MPKLPWIKFFPNDWLAEPTVRVCSVAARGLWMDMLSLMHLSPRRGYLLAATGSPISPEQLARLTGCSADEVTRLLAELGSSGAYSCADDGTIYSRRMVRDEGKREKCSEAGAKGGNPTLTVKDGPTTCPLKGESKGAPKGQSKGQSKPLEARGQTPEARGQTPPGPPAGGEGGESEDLPVEFPATRAPKPSEVVAVWNAQPKLVPCRSGDVNRERTIRAWGTSNADWVRHWRAVIEFLGRTPFFTGGGPSGWVATLDWLFDRSNFAKALDRMHAPAAEPAAPPPGKRRGPETIENVMALKKQGDEMRAKLDAADPAKRKAS